MASAPLLATQNIEVAPSTLADATSSSFANGNISPELAITPSEISSRILGMPDKSHSQRLQWLRQVIFSCDHRAVREDVELSLAQADNQFDCLVIHGRDLHRMRQLVRRIRKLMPGKLLVCLLDDVSSKATSDLLVSGVDVVASLSMDPVEARARLRSAYRRHSGLFDQWVDVSAGGAAFFDARVFQKAEAEVPFASLRRRERLIFKALLTKAGQLVTYEELEKLITSSTPGNMAGCKNMRKTLKIAVSRVRSILPNGLSVSNKSGRGYTLSLN